MSTSSSQYLFAWQAIPLFANAIYIFMSPGQWLHPSALTYENTMPALHVSSELSVTVALYYLLAAYRRDHGMMKLAIPLRAMAFLIGMSDGGKWRWVGLYELFMGVLTAWAIGVEGGW